MKGDIKRAVIRDKAQVESWKDLEVWKMAHRVVLEVYEITKSFPSSEQFRLTDQMCRAAMSVPTNIAEGKGRNSLREYLQFLSVARGSVEETKYLLLLSRDLGYLPVKRHSEIADECDQVARMLNGLRKSLKRHLPSETRSPKPKT